MDGSLGAVAQVSSLKGAECHSEHVIGTQVLVLGEGDELFIGDGWRLE